MRPGQRERGGLRLAGGHRASSRRSAPSSLFFAGLQRVGPTTASILSTVEPVDHGRCWRSSIFGESLGPVQLAGGALVIGCGVRAQRSGWSQRPARDRTAAASGAGLGCVAVSGPLTGKVALVTGATRGAGRGTAVALGEAGATVYCTGRTTRRAPLGVRPAGDDRGDRRARRRRRRRGHRGRGRPPASRRRSRRWSSASTPSGAAWTCS